MTEYAKDRPETIQSMFDSIASNYDKANSMMSFGLHKRWNKRLVHETVGSKSPKVFIDLCCGTGEIGYGYLKKAPEPCQMYMIDFSHEMLSCAKKKSKRMGNHPHTVEYLAADVQQLPLLDSLADCATMAYGIRNIKEPQRCLSEVLRVLKPGGTLGILELTRPTNTFLRTGHGIYLKTVLPVLGKIAASNKDAYHYLSASIQTFTDPAKLEQQMKEIGFTQTRRVPLAGGIATVILGTKP